jgi:hypothetical protein
VAAHIYTLTLHRTTQITTNVEECGTCPVFASFYPGICLATEEKARKKFSQGKRNLSQRYSIHLIFMDPCIVDDSEEIPTRCSFVIEFITPKFTEG